MGYTNVYEHKSVQRWRYTEWVSDKIVIGRKRKYRRTETDIKVDRLDELTHRKKIDEDWGRRVNLNIEMKLNMHSTDVDRQRAVPTFLCVDRQICRNICL